jgi:hypothetical protein
MPGVAQWLVRLEDVRGVTAVYLTNAVEEEIEERRLVTFDSTVELTQKVLNERFTAEGSP